MFEHERIQNWTAFRTLTRILGLMLIGVFAFQSARAQSKYTITDLGTTLGPSIADGINNSGQVVGVSYTATANSTIPHAFLYSGGKLLDLGTLGGSDSSASGINN